MNRFISTLSLAACLTAALGSAAAFAECKPGTPNCIRASSSIPKFCGGISKPCKIDGGLGSTCKGGGICGLDLGGFGDQKGGRTSSSGSGNISAYHIAVGALHRR